LASGHFGVGVRYEEDGAAAHAKASAAVSGYLASSSDEFDTAMGKFALAYADQAERNYAALKAAVQKGRLPPLGDPSLRQKRRFQRQT
jgi:hypothetical protein